MILWNWTKIEKRKAKIKNGVLVEEDLFADFNILMTEMYDIPNCAFPCRNIPTSLIKSYGEGFGFIFAVPATNSNKLERN